MKKIQTRLQTKYEGEIKKQLSQELSVKNMNAIPRVTKVVINSGIGKIIKSKELVEQIKKDLAVITGQKPSVRQAKVSVASFALRRGTPVGLQVTLRGDRMYSFLDKLFSIVLPRFRDFRGVSGKSFDSQGNYTLGIVEHTVFPEVDISKSTPYGMEVTVVTSTRDKNVAKRLLELLGMPFEKG
jgi:large subunit ribosomal protein L5